MYCRQCGQFLEDNMAFCPRCGAKNGDTNQSEILKVQIVNPPAKKSSAFSVWAIVFAAIGFIPALNFIFLPLSCIFAGLGLLLTVLKKRKIGTMIASFIVLGLSVAFSILWMTYLASLAS